MNLAEIRERYPAYKDKSDRELADAIYEKFYPGKDRQAFNKAIGYTPGTYEQIQEEHPILTDIAEQSGQKLLLGMADVAGLPGTMASLMNKGIDYATEKVGNFFGVDVPQDRVTSDFGTPESISRAIGIDKLQSEARTTPGAYAGAIAENVPGFMLPGAGALDKFARGAKTAKALRGLWGGNIPGKLGAAALSGGAEEAAGQVSDNDPWARAAGGLVGGGLAGLKDVASARKQIRTNLAKKNLAEEADKGYEELRANKNRIADTSLLGLGAAIKADWERQGLDEFNSKGAMDRLDKILSPSMSKSKMGPGANQTTISQLVNWHSAFGQAAVGTPERIAGNIAREHIEDFLEGFGPKLGKTYENARGNWAAHARQSDIEEALEKGERRASTTGRGFGRMNPIRQEINRIFKPGSKSAQGYSQEAKDQAARIIKGTIAENIARFGEIFAPYDLHRALGSLFLTTLSSKVSIPLAIGGVISKTVGDFLTEEEVRKLMDIVASEAPANKWYKGRNKALAYRARKDLADKILRATATGYSSGEQRNPTPQPAGPPGNAGGYGPSDRGGAPARQVSAPSDETGTPGPARIVVRPEGAGSLPGDIATFAKRGLSGVMENHGMTMPGTSVMRPAANALAEGAMWSQPEISRLRHVLLTARSWQEAGAALGRSARSVESMAQRLGFPAMKIQKGGRGPAPSAALGNRPPSGMEEGWSGRVLDALENAPES